MIVTLFQIYLLCLWHQDIDSVYMKDDDAFDPVIVRPNYGITFTAYGILDSAHNILEDTFAIPLELQDVPTSYNFCQKMKSNTQPRSTHQINICCPAITIYKTT